MIVIAILCFATGVIAGVVGLARWYVWRLQSPDVARAMLKNVYRHSHGHWLQVSRQNTTPVCPCCGWSETAALAIDQAAAEANGRVDGRVEVEVTTL